eukprot:SAG31_NODE_371_length_16628_cov_3.741943_10_plen_713_part_00
MRRGPTIHCAPPPMPLRSVPGPLDYGGTASFEHQRLDRSHQDISRHLKISQNISHHRVARAADGWRGGCSRRAVFPAALGAIALVAIAATALLLPGPLGAAGTRRRAPLRATAAGDTVAHAPSKMNTPHEYIPRMIVDGETLAKFSSRRGKQTPKLPATSKELIMVDLDAQDRVVVNPGPQPKPKQVGLDFPASESPDGEVGDASVPATGKQRLPSAVQPSPLLGLLQAAVHQQLPKEVPDATMKEVGKQAVLPGCGSAPMYEATSCSECPYTLIAELRYCTACLADKKTRVSLDPHSPGWIGNIKPIATLCQTSGSIPTDVTVTAAVDPPMPTSSQKLSISDGMSRSSKMRSIRDLTAEMLAIRKQIVSTIPHSSQYNEARQDYARKKLQLSQLISAGPALTGIEKQAVGSSFTPGEIPKPIPIQPLTLAADSEKGSSPSSSLVRPSSALSSISSSMAAGAPKSRVALLAEMWGKDHSGELAPQASDPSAAPAAPMTAIPNSLGMANPDGPTSSVGAAGGLETPETAHLATPGGLQSRQFALMAGLASLGGQIQTLNQQVKEIEQAAGIIALNESSTADLPPTTGGGTAGDVGAAIESAPEGDRLAIPNADSSAGPSFPASQTATQPAARSIECHDPSCGYSKANVLEDTGSEEPVDDVMSEGPVTDTLVSAAPAVEAPTEPVEPSSALLRHGGILRSVTKEIDAAAVERL